MNPFLVAGFLFFLSLIAGKISIKTRIPALILFLAVGMLAGVDGPGGLSFSDTEFSNLLGTVALAFILFSGGFETSWDEVKTIALPSMILATLGVFLTAVVTALLVHLFLGFSPEDSFLLGAIISSTDAAAVFAILRTQNCGLKGSLKPLLEFESGSNDPMAVFLTVATLAWIKQPDMNMSGMLWHFLIQMIFGVALGLILGKCACILLQRMRVENEALYPVMGISIVLFVFGFAETVGGNGYLALYICGIVMNSGDYIYKHNLARFHEGLGWMMQISMFLVLGLLVNPRELLTQSILIPGIMTSVFLMFVARPVAVFICTLKSNFSFKELVFISWTGLRGSVPIILATYPYVENHPQAHYIFNLIFFVVITSVLLQGKTMTPVAKWLGLDAPIRTPPLYPLSFNKTPHSGNKETRELDLLPDSCVIGHKVSELNFPESVTILLVHRGNNFLIPKGNTELQSGDTLLLFGERKHLSDVEAGLALRTYQVEGLEPAE